MIRLENISAGYGPCDVIREIDLSAASGEFIALLGPNGSGKSTLLKTVAGLVKARASGSVKISGTPIDDLSIKQRARAIAFLAQSREAQGDMQVEDILELGRAPFRGRLGRISSDGRQAIEMAVEKMDLPLLLKRQFGKLSGGEQARVLMARALSVNAPIFLADEPIAALDPYYQIMVMDVLKSEAGSGRTVIAALHDLALAAQYADRVWIMDKGQVMADGSPKQAMSDAVIAKIFKVRISDGAITRLGKT